MIHNFQPKACTTRDVHESIEKYIGVACMAYLLCSFWSIRSSSRHKTGFFLSGSYLTKVKEMHLTSDYS